MQTEFPFIVNGDRRQSAQRVEIRSPYNGEGVGVTFSPSESDVEEAVASAAASFQTTRRLPAYQRVEWLGRMVKSLKARQEEFARLIALECGKPIKLARAEARRALGTFQDALEEAKRLRGEVLPLDLERGSENRLAIVQRFPLGAVLAITPFNFPLNLVAHKVAPALACGNTMLLKPAPQAPLSGLMLAQIAVEAGWPPGTLNAMLCSNETAQRLVQDERFRMLTFTGSADVGWMLKERAGKKRVLLELGGNAGVAIHSDADLDHAAQRCAYGGFAYAGQICIAVQRIYVQRSVFEPFCHKFLQLVAGLKTGDPLDEVTDVGPMISRAAAQRAAQWIREAVEDGAKLLAGGECDRAFVTPTVLTGTRPEMRVCREEVFAPLVVLETYEALGDAIHAINDSRYGLQAGVFTRDVNVVFRAFSELEVGGVIINDVPTYRADVMPYGGTKESGVGREGVRYAIEEMTERKVLVMQPRLE